jgi:hypothetical protein
MKFNNNIIMYNLVIMEKRFAFLFCFKNIFHRLLAHVLVAGRLRCMEAFF